MATSKFVFPRWANYLLPILVLVALGSGPLALMLWTYGASPDTLNVGYQPDQPIPYSHKLHVGELGMDCKYCHTTVDKAAFAAVPPTETCISCHAPGKDAAGNPTNLPGFLQNSEKLKPLWKSYRTGEPIEWVNVHDLADYAYFDHSAHVNKGVSCVECHGRIDKMEKVYQAENLSMSWCLECHRNVEEHLRPVEHVTDLDWSPLESPLVKKAVKAGKLAKGDEQAAQEFIGTKIKKRYDIQGVASMTDCSTCHR